MSGQTIKSDLFVELSTQEQQLLAGGQGFGRGSWGGGSWGGGRWGRGSWGRGPWRGRGWGGRGRYC